VCQDILNAQTIIKFLERLIKDTCQKVFLVLDNFGCSLLQDGERMDSIASEKDRIIFLALLFTGI
jgi:hypothetical protein